MFSWQLPQGTENVYAGGLQILWQSYFNLMSIFFLKLRIFVLKLVVLFQYYDKGMRKAGLLREGVSFGD